MPVRRYAPMTRQGGRLSYDYVLSKGDVSMSLEDLMESAVNGAISSEEMLKASITSAACLRTRMQGSLSQIGH
jgi:hypothetical protein